LFPETEGSPPKDHPMSSMQSRHRAKVIQRNLSPDVRKGSYNECLKGLDFFKVIDTYTAFQELQMFLGGMARPNKPIPQVPDKDMVSIKGFDKWSFRKPPQSLE